MESSVWEESDMVVKVFITLLAKQDRDHVVRGSAYNIAKWANKTEAEVLEALKVLSEPDKRRLEPQEHEGRRIQKVEDGWLLLNGEKYQRLMMEMFRRTRNAEAMRKRREHDRACTTAPVAAGLPKPKYELHGGTLRSHIKHVVDTDPLTLADQAAMKKFDQAEVKSDETIEAGKDAGTGDLGRGDGSGGRTAEAFPEEPDPTYNEPPDDSGEVKS